MKTFIKFLLCTLFLCIQSSQAYVISAALWRFNENAGANAGTEVLILGGCHVNNPVGQEHSDALIKKINEWAQGEEKTHFMLESFYRNQNLKMIVYNNDTGQTTLEDVPLDQNEDPENQTIHILTNYVNYHHNANSSVQFNCADYRGYLCAFEDYCLGMSTSKFYMNNDNFNMIVQSKMPNFTIAPILNLKNFMEFVCGKTNESIQNSIRDFSKVTGEKDSLFQYLLLEIKKHQKNLMSIVQSHTKGALFVRNLQPKFLELYDAFNSYSLACADLGLLLELLKNIYLYRRHVVYVGAFHAVHINNFLQSFCLVDKVIELGRCKFDELYKIKNEIVQIRKSGTIPMDTSKLKSILDVAFTCITRDQISSNSFEYIAQNQESLACHDSTYRTSLFWLYIALVLIIGVLLVGIVLYFF